MDFYTYIWLEKNGTPRYVGKGIGDRAFRKGSPSRDRIILQEFPDEESAFIAEKFLIDFYGRKNAGQGPLINMIDGGKQPPSQKGIKRSPEAIRKTINTRKKRGIWHKEETKLKIGAANRIALSGRKLSSERCRQISQSLIGNKFTLGRKMSEEEKVKKRSFRHTEDAKKRIREAVILRRRNALPG